MQLKDFINYHVEAIAPGETLQQAAQKMRELDIGALPVCEDNRVVGVVTDRDITIRGTSRGYDPKSTAVNSVMTPDVICCHEDQTVEEAALLMQENQIRRLFVVNDESELIGVTTLGELATTTGDQCLAGATLERVSESSEFAAAGSEAGADLDDEDEVGADRAETTDETRITGLFEDSERAKEAVEELKDAGFGDDRIAIAMNDAGMQESLVSGMHVRTAPADELLTLPDLDEGQVLVMVDAADRADLALEIINRNRGVTGGARV